MNESSSGARSPWTVAETRVLVAIYFHANFSIGDDARYECQAIADAFGRTPSSIDRQWRNVQAVVHGKSNYNIGKTLKQAVQEYLNHPVGGTQLALLTCDQHKWPLHALVKGKELPQPVTLSGHVDGSHRDVAIARLGEVLSALEFKRFASGSQGYFVQKRIQVQPGVKHQAQVSAVLIGSKQDPDISAQASPVEIARALRPAIETIRQKIFNSGRSGFYASAKVSVRDERYQASIQIVTLGER